jgi:hypothetical protein
MEKSMVSVLVVENAGGGVAVAVKDVIPMSRIPKLPGKSCPHTAHKCSNCTAAGNTDIEHVAFNPRCPIKNQAVRDAGQKTRAAHKPDNTTDKSKAMNTNE